MKTMLAHFVSFFCFLPLISKNLRGLYCCQLPLGNNMLTAHSPQLQFPQKIYPQSQSHGADNHNSKMPTITKKLGHYHCPLSLLPTMRHRLASGQDCWHCRRPLLLPTICLPPPSNQKMLDNAGTANSLSTVRHQLCNSNAQFLMHSRKNEACKYGIAINNVALQCWPI